MSTAAAVEPDASHVMVLFVTALFAFPLLNQVQLQATEVLFDRGLANIDLKVTAWDTSQPFRF